MANQLDVYGHWPVPVECNLCHRKVDTVIYDFRVPQIGSWAIGCDDCFRTHSGKLGTGQGQKYKLVDGAWVKQRDITYLDESGKIAWEILEGMYKAQGKKIPKSVLVEYGKYTPPAKKSVKSAYQPKRIYNDIELQDGSISRLRVNIFHLGGFRECTHKTKDGKVIKIYVRLAYLMQIEDNMLVPVVFPTRLDPENESIYGYTRAVPGRTISLETFEETKLTEKGSE